MSHFDKVIDRTLEHEGGFVDHRHDPGGATNFGISLRWAHQEGSVHPELLALLDINHDGMITADDLKGLTIGQARQVYKDYFWRPEYDRIGSVDVAGKIFDMRVNMGRAQAHKIAQRCSRAHGWMLDDDGHIGEQSVEAFNVHGGTFLPTLREGFAGFHRMLASRSSALRKHNIESPDFAVFLNGWLKRDYS